MLVFMQIAYFNSQDDNCLYNAPNLYFFLMGQILTLYLGGAVVLCYFVRKVCQDPQLEAESQKQEAVYDKAKELAEADGKV